MTMNRYARKQTILMFPWLGHGHISPFLELAKKLSNTNLFDIYLCSTPANLTSIKSLPAIRLIELHLPTLPELPPHLHTTNGLPPHLMPVLKKAFDMARDRFSRILKTLQPDLLIYDIIQPWAPVAASALGIPAVVFITTSAAATMVHFHLNTRAGIALPFSAIYYRGYEYTKILESTAKIKEKEKDLVMECVNRSSSLVLVKSFMEIEGKYYDYLSCLTNKKIVPIGPLVVEPNNSPIVDMKENMIMEWLDTKEIGSTVFVSFGSEYFLSDDDLEEIAYGLEMSNVNFIWVLRFPKVKRKHTLLEALPLGFLERVKDKGLVIEGWAPQAKILGHKNIGGFVSHCGWSSAMEAMKFGVPVIAMPMHLDQPINARLVEEVGIGVEVVRDDNGRLRQEKMAAVVRRVVVSKLGEVVREKAKKMRVDLSVKREEEIDTAVVELLQLCRRGGGRREVKRTKSEAIAIGAYCAVKGEV